MKKIVFLTGAFCVVLLASFVFSFGAFALLYDEQGNPLPEVPVESPYDAALKKMLSKKDRSSDVRPPETVSPDASASDDADAVSDDSGASVIDELMKTLTRPSSPDVPKAPLPDGPLRELEGTWVVVREESGDLNPGKFSRIRLAALRKADGILDRALALEISPSGEEPFLIRLPDDVKGFESSFELKNFTAADSSEILLTVRSGALEKARFLIVKAANRGGEILYDSETVKIPAVMGRFFDDYRAEIIVKETDSHSLIDLSPRQAFYNRNLIYNRASGTLRSLVRIWISGSLQLQPVDFDKDGIFELRSVLELSGAGRADRIAYLESTLQYRDGGWKIVDCWVAPAEDLRLMPLPIREN